MITTPLPAEYLATAKQLIPLLGLESTITRARGIISPYASEAEVNRIVTELHNEAKRMVATARKPANLEAIVPRPGTSIADQRKPAKRALRRKAVGKSAKAKRR